MVSNLPKEIDYIVFWEDKDLEKLEDKMVNAFNEVYEVKKSNQVPMRIASFMVAIDRVHVAYNLREGQKEYN